MTDIKDKINQLPDGVNVWTNIYDPEFGKWKMNVQAFDSSDLKSLVSEVERLRAALAEVHETMDYARRHSGGLYGFTKYTEACTKILDIASTALQEKE